MEQLFFLVIPLSKNWYRTGDINVIFTVIIFSVLNITEPWILCSKILFRLGHSKPLILAIEGGKKFLSNADNWNKK